MKIKKLCELIINTDEEIITASLSDSDHLVVLLDSGDVIRYHIKDQKKQHLFSVIGKNLGTDKGFDL
jgi:hypothetical protein